MDTFLDKLTGAAPGDRLSPRDKLVIAASMGFNNLPSNIVLSQAPFIFEAYYKAPVVAIGYMGAIMGVYNMLNGVPIAVMADRGTLNERFPTIFPIETWGRRAPWIVIGLPINALAVLMVLFPPLEQGSDWVPEWYGLMLAVYFTGHTASTQQFYALPQELCANKKEVASLFSLIAPAYLISGQLMAYVPALIYAVRPTVGGAMNCCADPYTDCTTRPNCGCYLNATDPRGGASAGGWLEKEYAEVCPTSEFGSLKTREEACSVQQDGQLGSVGLVAFLIGGLSMLALWSLTPARKSPMRPVKKEDQLSFFRSAITTVKNDSFMLLTACMFSDASAVSIEGVFNSFFLTYSVGLDSAEMGTTMATVSMVLQFVPLFSIPFFRQLLHSGKARPWNVPRFSMLFQACIGPPLYLMVDKQTLWPLYLCAVLFGLSSGGNSMSNEMLRGWTMDDDEMKTGQRREGILLSVNAVFQFFSTTLSLAAVGIFSMTGYIFGVAGVKLLYFCLMTNWPIKGDRFDRMEAWIREHGQAGKSQRAADGTSSGSASHGSATLIAAYRPTHDRGLPCEINETVTVLRTEPEWVQVRNGAGQLGWVPLSFLKIEEGVAQTPSSAQAAPAATSEMDQGLMAQGATAL